MNARIRHAAVRALTMGVAAFLGFWFWGWLNGQADIALSPLEFALVFAASFFLLTLTFGDRK